MSDGAGTTPTPGASWLDPILHEVAELLPAQAPLEVFVHHNTLHAFQHLDFHDAVSKAADLLGARGYLEETEYRRALAAGRITEADLVAAIAERFPSLERSLAATLPQTSELARLIIVHGVHEHTSAGVLWQLDEHRGATRFAESVSPVAKERIVRETQLWLKQSVETMPIAEAIAMLTGPGDARYLAQTFEERFGRAASPASLRALISGSGEAVSVAALWEVTRALSSKRSGPRPPPRGSDAGGQGLLPRDAVLRVGADDPDDLVHPILITLAGAFLDRGQSHWSMPDRERGFFVAFRRVLAAGHAVRPAWLRHLGDLLRTWEALEESSEKVIESLLDELGIMPLERAAFIRSTVLRLPGWAGMFNRLQASTAASARSAAVVRLVDFLAVRLCLDVLALTDVGKKLGHHGPLADLRDHCFGLDPVGKRVRSEELDQAWSLFLLAQHAGIAAPELARLGSDEVRRVFELLDRFDEASRLAVWHEAYERHYADRFLTALHVRSKESRPEAPPRFQAFFCIDDRNESVRRHFEEAASEHTTFGVAGFFNLAIAYQGIDDPSTFPLCPVVLTPRHKVAEEPLSGQGPLAEARRRRLQSLTSVSVGIEKASRSMLWGAVLTAFAGFIAALPMLAAVFTPWIAGRVRKKVASWVVPAPRTRLLGARSQIDEQASIAVGFTTEEKVERVASLLENVGLTTGFARLVALIGHDSSSANNPHFAAYSCGACGGRSGGPNARLFAQMANRPEVRAALKERGIFVPDGTWFVGGEHDTCADAIRLFDLEEAPVELIPELEALQAALDRSLACNAHERCRKFASAPGRPSLDAARRHVEARSYDLSQARPELGHATNASCIVGRRSRSRGLFLDRRAFLVSYDPLADGEGKLLERILLAVGPVCAGINLEYLFSTTDNERLGAGTKLPHNVTGLFGVMNGASSDLRTGLPVQMVEIHEPLRLLLVVEAAAEVITGVLERQPSLRELVHNGWVRLACLSPQSGDISLFSPGRGFSPWSPTHERLPEVERSVDWYRGHAGLLSPALIVSDRAPLEEVGAGV